MNLIEILKNEITKPDILLSNNDKLLLQKTLLKNPSVFINIDQGINEIMKDGKISPHEIPQIIGIITDLISINNVDIIRFIIQSILSSKYLSLPEKELFMINKVINSSIKLLATNTKNKRFFCF
jgi:hypothetical protein